MTNQLIDKLFPSMKQNGAEKKMSNLLLTLSHIQVGFISNKSGPNLTTSRLVEGRWISRSNEAETYKNASYDRIYMYYTSHIEEKKKLPVLRRSSITDVRPLEDPSNGALSIIEFDASIRNSGGLLVSTTNHSLYCRHNIFAIDGQRCAEVCSNGTCRWLGVEGTHRICN